MVEFKIKIHPEQRVAYIPKEIFGVLSCSVRAVPNRMAVLMFSDQASTEDVLKSLDIIKADLQHAKELEDKESVT